MAKKPAIQSIRIQNLFSFGEESERIDLRPLNVLIGPNGSGKSNFVETIGLLKAIPKDFADAVVRSGGISDCLWRGTDETPVAQIEVVVNPRRTKSPIRYSLEFTKKARKLAIVDETVTTEGPAGPRGNVPTFLRYENGAPVLYSNGSKQSFPDDEQDPQQSVLSQRQDPTRYPEVTYLGRLLGSFRLYLDWEFGHASSVRELYRPEAKNDYLEEDISNLGIMLNRFDSDPHVGPELRRNLTAFYEDAVDIHTPIDSGKLDIHLEEKNQVSMLATRLSDGTLRWLFLLTILLHPAPPPLVCIEEPELGLHPDIMRPLADLMIEASERMQLIVTTHSDTLVDHLTEIPDSVVVCEKEEGATRLKRLDKQRLSSWLKRYRLGELWRTGEIGGTRW
ncbi:MAG: AAA family ATPase [Terriglobia bacterium]|jgi:predicted ATPase